MTRAPDFADLDLDALRARMDEIDRELSALVSRRAAIVRAIAQRKLDDRILVGEPGHRMMDVALEEARDGGEPDFVEGVFKRLAMLFEELEMSLTRDAPQKRQVAPQPLG